MIHLLFGRDHDGKIGVITMGDPDANDAFRKIVNAGKENADYSEIALVELNLYDARRRHQFLMPRSDEEKQAEAAANEGTRRARLLEEAREIQRDNEFVGKQIDQTKSRLRELSDEQKQVLAEEALKNTPSELETLGLLDYLTIPDLKALAEEEGIDLTGEDRKPEILARLRSFRQLRDDNTVDQLKDIATAETIDLAGLTRKNDIVNAIAASRRNKSTAS